VTGLALSVVIPGRAEGANPESITITGSMDSGSRASRSAGMTWGHYPRFRSFSPIEIVGE